MLSHVLLGEGDTTYRTRGHASIELGSQLRKIMWCLLVNLLTNKS